MRGYRFVKIWAIICTALLLITLFCWIRSLEVINEFVHAQPQRYEETEGKVVVTLPSQNVYTFSFAKYSVCIDPCGGASRNDALHLITFLKGYATKSELPIKRSTVELIGEYRLHTILSNIGYKTKQTNKADLDYIQDARWHVNAFSKVIGIVGL